MEFRLLPRPLLELSSGRSHCLFSLNASSRRYESSYRRTQQRLNIKPDPSFLHSKGSPAEDHIIFNPPSSAPSPLQTPAKFLPKEDKRKQLLALKPLFKTRLPPIISPQKIPHHHLTDKDIAQIQNLKRQNPEAWTNNKLAKKFNCSNHFIETCLAYCGVDNTKRKSEMKAKFEAAEARWGPRRRKAREETQRRFDLAYRGD